MRFVEDVQDRQRVSGPNLDRLLARGWRHFGTMFYRYNYAMMRGELQEIIPMRLNVADFKPRKSQRRILKKNDDTTTFFLPATVTPEKERMFRLHAERFDDNQPGSLYDFVSRRPQSVPCTCMNVDIFRGDRLIASSFLDVGETSVSSVYAIFDPDEARRGLGTYTALEEIRFAQERGKEHYYIGYGTNGPSIYDYKKKIGEMWGYDWRGTWCPLSAEGEE